MATRSLSVLTRLGNRSELFSSRLVVDSIGSLRTSHHLLSGLSANKSVKHMKIGNKSWTDKQHEEWVDRKFGHLEKPVGGKEDQKNAKAVKKSQ